LGVRERDGQVYEENYIMGSVVIYIIVVVVVGPIKSVGTLTYLIKSAFYLCILVTLLLVILYFWFYFSSHMITIIYYFYYFIIINSISISYCSRSSSSCD
jgi:hypothetical protein